ncbi:hypothetical protein THAOC_28462 [Thalassiosira oceanica]|uniref:Uncharacterized protein n=1 Tax=Thalassiosira oceanica TaxID=159749 RepID=K0RTS1_THAOC|nr:hypothetical protein THAOC_28462 [Thalassiosira oceanica]|eukprot:EJK52281.1 hypothetical protein THAOC_28462 [Thalassiosira oceanica]
MLDKAKLIKLASSMFCFPGCPQLYCTEQSQDIRSSVVIVGHSLALVLLLAFWGCTYFQRGGTAPLIVFSAIWCCFQGSDLCGDGFGIAPWALAADGLGNGSRGPSERLARGRVTSRGTLPMIVPSIGVHRDEVGGACNRGESIGGCFVLAGFSSNSFVLVLASNQLGKVQYKKTRVQIVSRAINCDAWCQFFPECIAENSEDFVLTGNRTLPESICATRRSYNNCELEINELVNYGCAPPEKLEERTDMNDQVYRAETDLEGVEALGYCDGS